MKSSKLIFLVLLLNFSLIFHSILSVKIRNLKIEDLLLNGNDSFASNGLDGELFKLIKESTNKVDEKIDIRDDINDIALSNIPGVNPKTGKKRRKKKHKKPSILNDFTAINFIEKSETEGNKVSESEKLKNKYSKKSVFDKLAEEDEKLKEGLTSANKNIDEFKKLQFNNNGEIRELTKKHIRRRSKQKHDKKKKRMFKRNKGIGYLILYLQI